MSEPVLIEFSQLGLASILRQNTLKVPANQRDYSWTKKEVRTLLQDFAKAIAESDEKTYFMGTIVTIPKKGWLEVVDGQQRLATIAIILAAIRNYLEETDEFIAKSIHSDFLTTPDREARAYIPRLTLNLDDNDYFRSHLLNESPNLEPSRNSHTLINEAFAEARNYIEDIVQGYDKKDHGDMLNAWIKFMESRAIAVLLRVPNDSDAYRMFETLNDRGLRTSQSDLVKNYLFGRAGDRLGEVQQKWALMRGALETIEDEDITIIFLRHALSVIYGFVREPQVYEAVQNKAKASQPVVTFATNLESLANTYVAIFNDEHEKWNKYSDATRKAIKVLNLFDIKPMRPLVLAVSEKMERRESEKCFKFLVSLGVRLMIASSTRTGSVEEGLSETAHKVFKEAIKTEEDLKTSLRSIIPSDTLFKTKFKDASVSNRKLARYYIRSLELVAKKEPEPWHIPNDDKNVINLEHILPEKTEGNWPQFTSDEVKLYHKKIGNLILLRASENSHLKSASFDEKKIAYKNSPYLLTQQISDLANWTINEIAQRQEMLADLSLKAWPI